MFVITEQPSVVQGIIHPALQSIHLHLNINPGLSEESLQKPSLSGIMDSNHLTATHHAASIQC